MDTKDTATSDSQQESPDPRPKRGPPPTKPGKSRNSRRLHMEAQRLRGVLGTEKSDEAPTLLVQVFPTHGGGVYLTEVEVEDDGIFTIPESDLTYYITPGSVWTEKGEYRAMVNEGNPMTISPHTLTGMDVLTPLALNKIGNNNLWAEYEDSTRPRNGWGRTAMITLGIAVVVVIGLLVWMILSMDSNMSGIEQALKDIKINNPPSGTTAGHQPIAPGS